MCMYQTPDTQTDRWDSDLDKHLYQYTHYEKIIPKIQERLLELKGERQIMNGSEWRAYQDEKQQVLTRTIDLQILYLEECQQKYLRVRKNVETAIEVELKKPRYRKFINLYWGSGLSKAEARKLVMQELELSQTTFYRWRKAILSKFAED
jgi:isochorismate hydrolase